MDVQTSSSNVDLSEINEYSEEGIREQQKLWPYLNIRKLCFEKAIEHRKTRKKLQRDPAYNHQMRSEFSRLKTFLSWSTRSTWSPQEMARAGFYSTGLNESIQCFSCGLVLCIQVVKVTPMTRHKKLNPRCDFIQGEDVGNIPKYDTRVQFPAEGAVDSAKTYKEEEERLESFKSWPHYAKTEPSKLAMAGWIFTGRKDIVQCFSCKGCLGNWEEDDDPWKEHAKWFPECKFLHDEKSESVIEGYIQNYQGYIGFTGKDFIESWNKRISLGETEHPMFSIYEDEAVRFESFRTWKQEGDVNAETWARLGFFYTGSTTVNVYQDEAIRLNSFENWPKDAHADPATLAQVGFFYTGRSDIVTCFCCGLGLCTFEEGDDPWKEHKRYQPDCKHLIGKMPKEDDKDPVESQPTGPLTESNVSKTLTEKTEDVVSFVKGLVIEENHWLEEADNLHELLIKTYNGKCFRKISSLGDFAHIAIDLRSLYADTVIVYKNASHTQIRLLTLPEVLPDLDSITMVEGETGSGKTALLKKIAILWASGCCPILNRFSLVIYLSLSSTEPVQSLSDMINAQLLGPTGSITETSLREIIQHLKNRALFLFDDYGEMDSALDIIEELVRRNYINKHCVVLAVRSDRSERIRKFANRTLSFLEFPLYSTIYMFRNLFSHKLDEVLIFVQQLLPSDSLHAAFKTPLFTVAHCAVWIQNPGKKTVRESDIFKAYLMYCTSRFPTETQKARAVISSCGDLALRGLFKPCFDFSDEDLSEVGLNGYKALKFGLLSKFTAQRLRPVYRFFHPSFQEFVAGAKMSEHLASKELEEVDKGFHYLDKIDTFLKVVGRYSFLLTSASQCSPKSAAKILSYIISLMDKKSALQCHSGNREHLQHHPELEEIEGVLITMISAQRLVPENLQTLLIELLLRFALSILDIRNEHSCAPILLEFLTGKTLSLTPASIGGDYFAILKFIQNYPQCLSLLSGIKVTLQGGNAKPWNILTQQIDFYANRETPTMEQDYSMALLDIKEIAQNLESLREKIGHMNSFYPKRIAIPDSFVFPFLSAEDHKVPLLEIKAMNHEALSQHDCENLTVLFAAAHHIQLHLFTTSRWVGSFQPVIDQFKDSFIKCHIENSVLHIEEQKAILSMNSIRSLAIHSQEDVHIPELVVKELNTFDCLKELTLSLHKGSKVFGELLKNFDKHINMEKLAITTYTLTKDDCSGIIEYIQNCKNLRVFYLESRCFDDFGALTIALSKCENIQEIRLKYFFQYKEIIDLGTSLPDLTSLKVLDLSGLHVMIEDISENFALQLGSLVNLEELGLPLGKGMRQVAKLVIEQLQRLPMLRILKCNQMLTDESLLQLAHTARDGYFLNLETLCCDLCNDITELGWRDFFQTMDNLPHLKELTISKGYPNIIKLHPTTVIAFVQFISRLPSIIEVAVYGLLFDAEDLAMFNFMKEKHPQSKNLTLYWQFSLPYSPL